jgi:hypothetical protein
VPRLQWLLVRWLVVVLVPWRRKNLFVRSVYLWKQGCECYKDRNREVRGRCYIGFGNWTPELTFRSLRRVRLDESTSMTTPR